MDMEMGNGSGMGCVGGRMDFRVFANVANAMCAAFCNYVIVVAFCKTCFCMTCDVHFAGWIVASGLSLGYCGYFRLLCCFKLFVSELLWLHFGMFWFASSVT